MAKARRQQRGSEWFRTNSKDDQKMQLATLRHGIKLKGMQTVLDMFICQNDYYYEVTDETYDTLDAFYGCRDRAEVDEMIGALVKADAYNSDIYEQYNILTNERLQDGFAEIGRQRVSSKRRADADYREPIYKELWLIDLKKKAPFFEFISLNDDELINSSETVHEQLTNGFEHRREEDRRAEDRREEDRRAEDRRAEQYKYTIEEIDSNRKSDAVDTLIYFTDTQLNKLACNQDTYQKNKSNIRQIILFYGKAYELYRDSVIPDSFYDRLEYACKQLAEPVCIPDTGEAILTIDDTELYKKTIKKYFETDMSCDYSMTHFLSGDIRLHAVQDVMREE